MSHAQDSPLGDRETSRRRLGGSLQRPWAYQRRPWPSCQSLWVCDRRLWATTAPLLTLLCWAIALTHAPVLGQEDSSATDSSLSERFRKVSSWAKQFQGKVPGSRLTTPEDVEFVRNSLHCLAHKGRWVFNPNPRPIPWHYEGLDICDKRWMKSHPTSGLAGPAANRVKNASQWNIRPGLKYEWQPSEDCGHWQPFDPHFFCAVMKKLGGPLLIVGDSLSKIMLDSLLNQMQIGQSHPKNVLFTPQICKHWERTGRVEPMRATCRGIGLCGFPIVRVRNDRLTHVQRLPHERTLKVHGQRHTEYYLPWMSLIETWGMRAVVLNRGVHFAATPQFEEELEVTLLLLREKYPDLLIMFRATAPGHDQCESLETPLESPQEGDNLPYNWGAMHEQNLVAKRIVEKYGGVFLDIEPMTLVRGDGHRGHVRTLAGMVHDCLHYCNPGPVDEWNRLFQNALSRLV